MIFKEYNVFDHDESPLEPANTLIDSNPLQAVGLYTDTVGN